MMTHFDSTNYNGPSAISETFNKDSKLDNYISGTISANRTVLNHLKMITGKTKLAHAYLKTS